MKCQRKTWGVLSLVSALLVAGCGGGGGGGDTPAPTPVPKAAQLVGTAATGAALAKAPVTITDSAGQSPCEESSITTNEQGSYTCTLKAGETAPFFVVVTDPNGLIPPLVSVSTTTPAAGASLTVNATPLTTAIVAQLGGGDALAVVNSKTVDAAKLDAIKANVVSQLSQVLTSIGAPTDYDPFSTSITAATASNTGNTADLVLDVVKVSKDPSTGTLQLTTISDPTPVPLATSTSSGTAVSVNTSAATLSQAMQQTASSFNACFAVPAAQRAVTTDTTIPATQGGPAVTQVGTACQNILASASNGAGMDFLHNGYNAGQLFYSLLTSDSMTGAQFGVPQIVLYYPAGTGTGIQALDHAIVNLRYVDGQGNSANQITVAARIPNSKTTAHPSDWWLVGNQQSVDINVRAVLRRVEQMKPSYTGGNFSRFMSGLVFTVDALGPGSVDPTDGPMSYAVVTGPGLPTAGLVLKAPTLQGQTYMDIANKTGVVPATTVCGGTLYNCPNFWIERTADLNGTPGTNPVSPFWVQPGDTLDTRPITTGQQYVFKLYFGTNTTPKMTVTKTQLSDYVPASAGKNLAWNTPTAATLALLDPTNTATSGAMSTVPLAWTQNPAAEQIGSVLTNVDATGTFGIGTSVPRGATSVTVNQAIPALTTSNTRLFMLSYRMTNGSAKNAVYTYN